MTDAELAVFVSGFLTAGHESTASALASLLIHVLSRPDLKERMLAGDEKAITGSIEEAVRLHPPFQAFYRTTTESVDVATRLRRIHPGPTGNAHCSQCTVAQAPRHSLA
jgi:cytochrome P450